MAAGASAFGWSTRATIPFDFVVGGKTLPAGEYSFVMTAGRPVVAIQGEDGKSVMVFMSRRLGNYQRESKPQFVFEKKNQRYVLKEVVTTTDRETKPVK
jgi:hypothetical protein